MTEAEIAYIVAQELIAEAKRTGSAELAFYDQGLEALDTIPPEIAELDQITFLDLMNTSIWDLTPISGMTGMIELHLRGAEVDDLTPISDMTGMTILDLGNTQVSDLAPINGMTDMTTLYLDSTQVSDLMPISGMAGMTTLHLDNSQVSDLAPIQGLGKLATSPDLGRLMFHSTPATRGDSRIEEISYIQDDRDRATQLLKYLENRGMPIEGNSPKPGALLPVDIEDGRLEIAASYPDAAERDDTLKRALHERLRPKAAELAQAAGNYHPRLAARARSLTDRLNRPFEDLEMLQIHMDVEDLSSTYRNRDARTGEEVLSGEIVDALADVTNIGPGLTLDNTDVELLEGRKRRFAASPQDADVQAAHDAMSKVVADDQDTMGERLRALEERLLNRQGETSTEALQNSVNRNLLIRMGRELIVIDGRSITQSVIASAIVLFAQANSEVIMALLSTYGPALTHWFAAAVSDIKELTGVFANIEAKPINKKPKK